MSEVEELLEQAEWAAALGNLVLPVGACVERLGSATAAEKIVLAACLRDLMRKYAARCAPEEARRLGDLSSRLPDAMAEELAGLIPSPIEPRSLPGMASLLFASTRDFEGRRFGVVHTLQVVVPPWAHDRRMPDPRGMQDALASVLERAKRVSFAYIYGRGLGTLDSAIVLNGRSVFGELPGLREGFTGQSLGLGAAVAVLSALLEIPVPWTTGFTGEVDLKGGIHGVGWLPEKLEAAAQKGLRRIFCPLENTRDLISATGHGLQVDPVAAFDDVIEKLFAKSELEAALMRLKNFPLAPELRERTWLLASEERSGAERILLTVVGGNDPRGAPRSVAGEETTKEDGPILTLCDTLAPAKVFLFHTPGRFKDRADVVKAAILASTRECVVELIELSELLDPETETVDPTDFRRVFPALRERVLSILELLDTPNTMIYTNVSSGTPQMDMTLHLLVERGILPDNRLQVRESRWLRPGESRVRQVILPVL